MTSTLSPHIRARKDDHPAFATMLAIARKTKRPGSFGNDLEVHDRTSLAAFDKSKGFAWLLGKRGTHLLLPRSMAPTKRGDLFELLKAAQEACDSSDLYVLWWTGKELLPATLAEARSLLAQAFELEWRPGAPTDDDDDARGALQMMQWHKADRMNRLERTPA